MIIKRLKIFSEAGKKKLEERARKKASKNKWLLDTYGPKGRVPGTEFDNSTKLLWYADDPGKASRIKSARRWMHYEGDHSWGDKSHPDLEIRSIKDALKASDSPVHTSINTKAHLKTGGSRYRPDRPYFDHGFRSGKTLVGVPGKKPLKYNIKEVHKIMKKAAKHRR